MSARARQDIARTDLVANGGSTQPGTVQRWTAAAVLVTGAVAANIAFFGLGSSFEYPDILDQPTQDVLQLFDDTRSATMAWFATLALGAALLIPGAILLARFGSGRVAKWSAWAGVTAGVVQVIGLSRWFLLVPGYVDRALDQTATAAERSDARTDFETAHDVLGTIVGETLGYVFTSAWTILVLLAFPAAATWWRASGGFTAVLILLGVLDPLGVPGTDLANFIGYVLWSLWLIALAVLLVRKQLDNDRAGHPKPTASAKPTAGLLNDVR